jgi:hypothetical protein
MGRYRLLFDAGLPFVGTFLALTAAWSFTFVRQKTTNAASGVLDEEATVTPSEMFEHAFYQGLNVVQIVYLHAISEMDALQDQSMLGTLARFSAVFGATVPWLLRSRFPINSFSDNYAKEKGQDPNKWTNVLYRLKKYQYLLYKHCLLHGLNMTVAVSGNAKGLTSRPYFLLYWMGLNTAYVMEFFLQTLVKRGYMNQSQMLRMNQTLMAISTVAALQLIYHHVSLPISAVSLVLNLANRGQEFLNVMGILAPAAFTWWWSVA